jgi:uncharacterized protein (TIGR03437 family)
MALNSTGSAALVDTSYAQGARGAGLALDGNGMIHAAGGLGLVTILDRTPSPSGMSGAGNAAGGPVKGRLAPGELISIYGWNLGDEVFLDELPVPVVYKSSTQVNAVVPFGAAGRDRVSIRVRKNGEDTAKALVVIAPASPEIFKSQGSLAAALNEDGTVNSKDNPANPGSLITIWGTGAANWPRRATDGSINPIFPPTYLEVKASVGFQQYTEITFSGAAPGLLAGVFQINLRLPLNTRPGPIYLLNMGEVSEPASVYIRQ